MKPGKPLTFATLEARVRGSIDTRQMLVFGLPGNPVSSAVTFNLVAVPAIRQLAGWPNPNLRRVQARILQPLRLDPERPEYHRATVWWAVNDGSGNPGYCFSYRLV
jgi:gephyrin